MKASEIEALFPGRVSAACGWCEPHTVKVYRELRNEERPEGFSRWAEKRQREFRAGRHFADQALAPWFEREALRERAIPRDEDGVPLFPSGLSGSITHTGRATTFAAAVVGPGDCPLGLDAELRSSWSSKLSDSILGVDEQSNLARRATTLSLQLKAPDEVGLLAFSAKEAFYKCVFPRTRIRLGFRDVEFRLVDEQSFTVQLRTPHLALPQCLRGRLFLSEDLVVCGVFWPPRDSTSGGI